MKPWYHVQGNSLNICKQQCYKYGSECHKILFCLTK